MTDESVEELIQIGQLAYAPPEIVCDALAKYGKKLQTEDLLHPSKSLEKALLSRHEPTINFALAQYAGADETLKALYTRSGVDAKDETEEVYLRSLRVAVLSNTTQTGIFRIFPINVIGEDELERIINDAKSTEAYALFSNSRIASSLLESLFKRTGMFEKIDDERWRELVWCAGRNPRLNNKDDEYGPDFDFMDIHNAIWKLVEKAPTTRHWMVSLRDFFSHVNPFHLRSPKNSAFMDSIKRWKDVPALKEGDRDNGWYTSLSAIDEFCVELAAMFGTYASKETEYETKQLGSMNSDDLLKRCAYYGNAKLSVAEMDQAETRDEDAYLIAILHNRNVLMKRETRLHLEENQISSDILWLYQRRCNQLGEAYKSFDPKPVSEWMQDHDDDDFVPEPGVQVPEWATALASKVDSLVQQASENEKSIVRIQSIVSGVFGTLLAYVVWVWIL